MRIDKNSIERVFLAPKMGIKTLELKGYELIENLFVDSSGWGAENEPAYTKNAFINRIEYLVSLHDVVHAFITDVGMFQVYVGIFKKTGKSKMKKIAHNTYEIRGENGYSIRLHDTNILEFQGENITLDSGGWHSHTTKKRMNAYLPRGLYIQQKDFEWYVVNSLENTKTPFVDGMEIKMPL